MAQVGQIQRKWWTGHYFGRLGAEWILQGLAADRIDQGFVQVVETWRCVAPGPGGLGAQVGQIQRKRWRGHYFGRLGAEWILQGMSADRIDGQGFVQVTETWRCVTAAPAGPGGPADDGNDNDGSPPQEPAAPAPPQEPAAPPQEPAAPPAAAMIPPVPQIPAYVPAATVAPATTVTPAAKKEEEVEVVAEEIGIQELEAAMAAAEAKDRTKGAIVKEEIKGEAEEEAKAEETKGEAEVVTSSSSGAGATSSSSGPVDETTDEETGPDTIVVDETLDDATLMLARIMKARVRKWKKTLSTERKVFYGVVDNSKRST